MGKKKKKSSKKTAKSRASSSANSAKQSNKPQPLSLDAKEFYLNQVRDVEKRVAYLQRRCDELELFNRHLDEQDTTVKVDGAEVVDYLKKQVEEKTEIIAELQEELKALQEAHESEQKTYAGQITQLKKDFNDTKEQLTAEGFILDGKLSSLDEYRVQREELQEKFAEIQDRIAKQSLIHREEIYQLERQAVVDKDKLNKEMLERVNVVASEFRKVSNKQMAETTQKTIEENSTLNKTLNTLSDKITKLIEENDALRSKDKSLSTEMKVLEDMDKEMANKSSNTLKNIRTLMDTCRDADDSLMDMEDRAADADNIRAEHALLTQQADAQSEELDVLRNDRDQQQRSMEEHQLSLADEQRRHRKLHRLLSQSQRAVVDCQATLTPDEEMTESEAVVIRRKMLITILGLLNTAADLGVGPEPAVLGRAGLKENFERPAPVKTPKISREGPRVDLVSSRLGELGLAPLKKVPSRSAGVQASSKVYMQDKLAMSQLPIKNPARRIPTGIF